MTASSAPENATPRDAVCDAVVTASGHCDAVAHARSLEQPWRRGIDRVASSPDAVATRCDAVTKRPTPSSASHAYRGVQRDAVASDPDYSYFNCHTIARPWRSRVPSFQLLAGGGSR